ncbi:MAG TPA: hypothetical protein VFM29_07740 [Vicinamibacteria bacterium]|nr:hypothetical protein [Vicinamibacteria bacterium]
MSKTLRSRPLVVLGLAIAVIALSSVADAGHAWGNYHWARTSNPFTLKVGDNMSSAWDAYLDEAIADWSASSVLNLTKVAGGTRPKNCRPTSGRIEACNASYGNTGWLGIAQIWASGSHITQAVAKNNDTYFNTSTYNTPAWRRLVTCQEIAHGFGLGHQDEDFDNGNLGSCMDYTSDPDGPPSNEHPNSHDFAQLEAIYSHLDSTTTVGMAVNDHPQGMNAISPVRKSEFGRLVASTPNGRAQVYELDFGRGQRILTHVIWAEGHEHGRHTE